MGLGTVVPMLVVVGFLVLGPKRMQEMLGRVAKMKADFERSSREIKSRLASELDTGTEGNKITRASLRPAPIATIESNGAQHDT